MSVKNACTLRKKTNSFTSANEHLYVRVCVRMWFKRFSTPTQHLIAIKSEKILFIQNITWHAINHIKKNTLSHLFFLFLSSQAGFYLYIFNAMKCDHQTKNELIQKYIYSICIIHSWKSDAIRHREKVKGIKGGHGNTI